MLIIIFLRWRFMVYGAFCGYKKSTECRMRLAGGGGQSSWDTYSPCPGSYTRHLGWRIGTACHVRQSWLLRRRQGSPSNTLWSDSCSVPLWVLNTGTNISTNGQTPKTKNRPPGSLWHRRGSVPVQPPEMSGSTVTTVSGETSFPPLPVALLTRAHLPYRSPPLPQTLH